MGIAEDNKAWLDKNGVNWMKQASGLAADRPSVLYSPTVYMATDTQKASIWYDGAWNSLGNDAEPVIHAMVNNYSSLPTASTVNGKIYLAQTRSGGGHLNNDVVAGINYPAGLWVSNASSWHYLGAKIKGFTYGQVNNPEPYHEKMMCSPNDVFKIAQAAAIPLGNPNSPASGYADIGKLRIQWGTKNASNSGNRFDFPVPFYNSNYSLQLTQTGSSGNNIVLGGQRSTTSYFYVGVITANTNSYYTGTVEVSWLAIGTNAG